MGKYLDPRADLTFKKIFGEHKHLVISLLNAFLPLEDDERVESIEYWPADKIPDRTEAEKYSIVDVCCKDNKQREFIVEMQMTWTDSFKKRVLLNASKAYVAQTKKGMVYESLQPVYALNFVNAEFLKDVEEYYHYYHLVHDKYTDQVIDGLHLIFVELPKFKPQTMAEKKMQVLWLRFLTEINENTQEVPAELLESAEVSEALEIVERAAFNDEEMRTYDKFWDSISSYRTLMYDLEKDVEQRMKQADQAMKQANQTMKQAEQKAEQAEQKAEQAKQKAEQADQTMKQAEQKAEQAEQTMKQAEQKAEQAEQTMKQADQTMKQAAQTMKQAEQTMKQAEQKVEQEKIITVRRMKAKGYAAQDISEITGLTVDEIEKL